MDRHRGSPTRAPTSPPPPPRCFFCAPPAAAAAPDSVPKPPRITDRNGRFIALHMMYDRIAPELPTSEPAMINIGLFSEKPMPAAAQPEYELSMEITTGMSAPPIGIM